MKKQSLSRKYISKKETKGFNLFSSVVVAVLVMSAVVLVNTLISTEEKTNTQVNLMVNSFELSDAASLARADSLQSFNYFFRERMEDWLTCKYDACKTQSGDGYESGFAILNMNNVDNWNQLELAFQDAILLNNPNNPNNFNAVIKFIADQTIDRFDTTSYGKYNIALTDTSEDAKEALKNAMSEAITKASTAGDKFIEVVDCDESNCNVGTFYFNVDLGRIDANTYEKLPRIIIRDTTSREEMKVAILPKTNLKIYVPLRFFKVIYEARIQALRIKNNANQQLQEAKLGICGDGCSPRTDPLSENNTDDWDKSCPVNSNVTQSLNPPYVGISEYFPSDAKTGLFAFTKKTICDAMSGLDYTPNDSGFTNYNANNGGLIGFSGYTSIMNCPFSQINAESDDYDSKIVKNSTSFLKCLEIVRTDSTTIYSDENPAYIVSGTKNLYAIKITTGYYTANGVGPGGTLGICGNDYAGACKKN